MFEKKEIFGVATLQNLKTVDNGNWQSNREIIDALTEHTQECHNEIDRLERENDELKKMVPEVDWNVKVTRPTEYLSKGRTPEEAEKFLRRILPHIFDEGAEIASVTAVK